MASCLEVSCVVSFVIFGLRVGQQGDCVLVIVIEMVGVWLEMKRQSQSQSV